MPSKRSSSFFGLLRFFYYFISFYFQKGLQTSVVKANRPPLTTTHKKKSKKKGKKKERIEQVNRLPSFNPIKLTKKKRRNPHRKKGFYREGCKRTKKRKKKKKKKERYFIAAPPSPSGGDKITKGETKRERRHKTQYVDKIGYRLDRTNSSVEEDLIAKKKSRNPSVPFFAEQFLQKNKRHSLELGNKKKECRAKLGKMLRSRSKDEKKRGETG